MTRKIAQRLVNSAIAESKERKVKMNIAVVDVGANLVSFTRYIIFYLTKYAIFGPNRSFWPKMAYFDVFGPFP